MHLKSILSAIAKALNTYVDVIFQYYKNLQMYFYFLITV